MMENSTIAFLKQALHDLQRSVNESNKTNRVLALSNLITCSVITKEEALNDIVYREYVNSLKKTNTNVIKADVKRSK